jgi:hypothetical protein
VPTARVVQQKRIAEAIFAQANLARQSFGIGCIPMDRMKPAHRNPAYFRINITKNA